MTAERRDHVEPTGLDRGRSSGLDGLRGIRLPAGLSFPEAYVGGTPSELPDRYTMASPFRLIRAGLPPTLLITGENDHLVLRPRVTSILDALKSAGSEVRLLIVPFAEHGFDGLPNAFGAQVEESIVPAFVSEVAG